MDDDLLQPISTDGERKIYALKYNGRYEAREFYDTALNEKARNKYRTTFYRVGHLQPVLFDKHHKLDPTKEGGAKAKDVHEFKDIDSKSRIMGFEHNREENGKVVEKRIILTHGFFKKGNRLSTGEIDHVNTLRDFVTVHAPRGT